MLPNAEPLNADFGLQSSAQRSDTYILAQPDLRSSSVGRRDRFNLIESTVHPPLQQ